MKNAITLSVYFLLISITSLYASEKNTDNFYGNQYGKSYIFTEQNVEFSVYPDGQFDFTYLGNYNGSNTSLIISSPNVNISYNSGYNFDMYVQYDDYGAVIQVEDIPIYYDEFGRIVQAGSVEIRYYNSRLVRVGGLQVHYNNYGNFAYTMGFINPFNHYYVYRPWHAFYARPFYANCIVYNYSYRRHYNPTRYTYNVHSNYYSNRGRSNISYTNGRRSFNRPGSRVHYRSGRTAVNNEYKSNRRNNSIATNSTRNNVVSNRRNNSAVRDNATVRRNNNTSRKPSVKTRKNSSVAIANKRAYVKDNSRNSRGYTSNNKRSSYKKPDVKKTSSNRYASSNTARNKTVRNNSRSYANKGVSKKRVSSSPARSYSKKARSSSPNKGTTFRKRI